MPGWFSDSSVSVIVSGAERGEANSRVVRLNHVARFIGNANHSIVRTAKKFRIFPGVSQRENRCNYEYSLGAGWNWDSKIHNGLNELKDDL